MGIVRLHLQWLTSFITVQFETSGPIGKLSSEFAFFSM
jgi:hypothetical protein